MAAQTEPSSDSSIIDSSIVHNSRWIWKANTKTLCDVKYQEKSRDYRKGLVSLYPELDNTGAVQVCRPLCLAHLHPSNFRAHCLGFRTVLHGDYEFGPWIWRNLGSNSLPSDN